MIRMGLVGLGKMGISHLAIANSHPAVTLAAVCDSSGYSLQVLNKYSAFRTFTEFDAMIAEADLDAVIIATPSRLHVEMARAALDRGLFAVLFAAASALTPAPHSAWTIHRGQSWRASRTATGASIRWAITAGSSVLSVKRNALWPPACSAAFIM